MLPPSALAATPRALPRIIRGAAAATMLLALTGLSRAESHDFVVRLDQIEITEGSLPGRFFPGRTGLRASARIALMAPRVILDDPLEGEDATLLLPEGAEAVPVPNTALRIVVRVIEDRELSGRLLSPTSDFSEIATIRFRIPVGAGTPAKAAEFEIGKRQTYQRLRDAGLPGTAWYRWKTDQLRQAAENRRLQPGEWSSANSGSGEFWGREETGRRSTRESELQRSFALFTGARAMSENLQLDRILRVEESSGATVDVKSLTGITIRPYDWRERLGNEEVRLDPLAAYLPADQHAVFFPSFTALLRVVDEAERNGTPIVQMVEEAGVSALTRKRYEQQLCLQLNSLTRRIGPLLIQSVALTGSDPYLRTGSDVAVLFKSSNPEALMTLLETAQIAARETHAHVESVSGKVESLSYQGVRSNDRSISSLMAREGDVILVTNSLVQLRAFQQVRSGGREALAGLDEYSFFRRRYPVGTQEESAFLMLTDATIRRWCGPRWRIGASRRIHAAATMAHLRALEIEQLAQSAAAGDALASLDATYGNLAFQTPIAELDLNRVTEEEAAAYRMFRESYQRNWQQFFDPIALSLSIDEQGGLSTDLSVMPLIANSDFDEYVEITRGVEIQPQAGDPHPEAIFHFAQSVNIDSRQLKDMGEFFKGMLVGFNVHPLSWMDGSFSIYIDDDPVLDLLRESDDPEDFAEDHWMGLPVAMTVEVKDPLRLAAFLTAVRSLVQTSAPGVVSWETREHAGTTYVVATASEIFREEDQEPSLYYAVLPGRLTLTLSETVLKRAIDRANAPAGSAGPGTLQQWLGKSVAVRLEGRALKVLEGLTGEWREQSMRIASWRNIPILNEWKRLFPDQDPVVFHEMKFHQRLTCPAGGRYVWNEQYQSMESTALGLPGAPRNDVQAKTVFDLVKDASLGVTFEEDGLRARLDMKRH